MTEETIKDAEIVDLSKQKETNNSDLEDLSDQAYDYTRLGVYTSELYKIEIQNIPRFLTHVTLKKFLNRFNLVTKKVKVIKNNRGGAQYAFATFENEEERCKAIDLVNNYVFKNCKLKVTKAKPARNPAILTSRNDKVEKINYDELSEEQLQQLLFKQICPLHEQSYDCQLQEKQESHRKLLDELLIEVKELYSNSNNRSDAYLDKQPELSEVFGEIKAIKEKCTKYRNKCEFSFGQDGSIGFRLGRFKDGVKVVKPLNCILLNDTMNKAIDLIEKYTKEQTDLKPFDLVNRRGNFKQLTVRTSKVGCMIILCLNTNDLDDAKLNCEIEKLKTLIQNEADYVTSFYIDIQNEKQLDNSKTKRQNGLTHVFGDMNLIEKMRNDELQYAISPSAFFQINVPAAELLYETIAQMLNLNKNVILLDICSGIGSIGIYLANKVKHVIGVELNKDAVNDAVYNARLNKIDNISFIQGMAEEKLSTMLKRAKEIDSTCEIVGILDPPRAGLKNNIISLIRNCNDIRTLAYVCCEAKFSRQNLIEPCSARYAGSPFVLAQAVSVDMFPYTSKCELVNIFKREVSNKRGKAAAKKVDDVKEGEKVGETEIRTDETSNEHDVKDPQSSSPSSSQNNSENNSEKDTGNYLENHSENHSEKYSHNYSENYSGIYSQNVLPEPLEDAGTVDVNVAKESNK